MARAEALTPSDTGAADPGRGIDELCLVLEAYLDPDQVDMVRRAYRFGAAAHEGQQRLSGEPYITHPVAVAKVLAEMRLDVQSIVAAILHDVIEDTPTAKEHIATDFGEEVAELVDGVSKLTQIHFESKAEAQAANFRKMVLAMARDIRVIIIKLADRLHNMRTIWVMPPHKRRRIARETMEIYAPVAHRLGINNMRIELEDLSFAAMYPMRFRVLKSQVRKVRRNQKALLGRVREAMTERLAGSGIEPVVTGREKHLFSVYRKMRNEGGERKPFNAIFDVHGIRVTVEDVDACYRTLGVMHGLYKPVPGHFKDYIAIPKSNGYQSLHTMLWGPQGVQMEVQIRTHEMDRVAEMGVAAHWMYKTGEAGQNTAQTRAREWVKDLLEIQRNAGNPLEFIESVKVDLFPDEVYVFTPRGEIMELPRGATMVDFAYAVHSDIGDTCLAAKVDKRLVPLRMPLQTGQTVEIITAPGARPNPAWLDFVVTAKARSAIRHALKTLRHEEAESLGKRLVDQVLEGMDRSLDSLPAEQLETGLRSAGAENLSQLLQDVGLGRLMPWLAARHLSGLVEERSDAEKERDPRERLTIKGTEGAVVTFARCCNPIPGDPIVGFASSGRGVVVHLQDCRNLVEYRKHPEKWLDVQWERDIDRDFSVPVRVDVVNGRGVLAEVASSISDMDGNILSVAVDERDGMIVTINLSIAVRSRLHLARIMRRLRVLKSVLRINRVKG
ncbi:bifunctional GTP diphosphokinase/guanosine-3',5'-bis pyrophosphate 3'-pyrophosphohydrolase [Methylonatrum kenyense]|uniref:bifunctional GTP diphosphokinase/guanosine-3',5'-bis pyrophosphate 3'-pyrophosphohydrolase n=1 Tax=Methylonatrum kenyense TaxID=455253 RepID=UPI0020BF4EF0|nr:bifunctional GTP diphosphokinase/guanosine-3',5'-bis pyrophosphate 3'-pyrophosphohydrolase [Methylonatrum kenyense]MCK8516866.1 bifunctional GTP diphosphokinase/guanosine-3',5'-bis pyrophosphate 3'-pyrophosphohydrolase [Methylonatrum kenyense]